MYEYRAQCLAAHDGDTVTVMLDQGLKEYRRMNIRLRGINAPELATPAGPPARDYLLAMLGALPAAIVIRTHKDQADKYGERWEGTLWRESDGMWGSDNAFLVTVPSLNQQMVDAGQAVAYP